MNKWRLLLICSLVLLLFCVLPETKALAKTNKPLIGIVVSDLSERYPYVIRPSGIYQGTLIAAKEAQSSNKNKRIKAKLLYESLGYETKYVSDKDLTSFGKLKELDTLVFPNTVMMSIEQRNNVKRYIRDGGGAIFAFAFARNESSRYPFKAGELDRSPAIYGTKTWIYEWDELSPLMQTAFVNDAAVGRFSVKEASGHEIVKKTLARTGKSTLEVHNNRSKTGASDWIEVIKPYPGGKTVPLLKYSHIGYSNAPADTPAGTTAAYAMQYGNGKAVWFGFQLLNYVEVDSSKTSEWEKPEKEVTGQAWDGLTGGADLKILLDESVKWTSVPNKEFLPINQKVNISLTNTSAYPRASDYVLYGTMTAQNAGTTISRGMMRAEVISPAGKTLASYQKYTNGLSPAGSANAVSYPEKFQFSLPKNLPAGRYTLRTTYFAGRETKAVAPLASDSKLLTIKKNTPKAEISEIGFSDVAANHWARADILNLYNAGVYPGYSAALFRPDAPITRLEAAEVIVKSLKLNTANRPRPNISDILPGQKGYGTIAAVMDEGIFNGSNGKFRPNDYLSREQMAKILVEAFRLSGSTAKNFPDIEKNRWSKPYIDVLTATQVTSGTSKFHPFQKTSRAQYAAFVRRSLSSMEERY